ncbi:anaerobic ribonucleoside-triphosphate reductase activating protein [Poseidonibacter ostreae]|uniref:Anaerobic ribonucleoside-triphosphate reductase activating protein n=1 Tax=Poseidonibacter ostreae TaxID=2654171 RepID=A0A6L4WSE6_9BACT|nr:anaerobic ribonucleoside-triphosphate reductase activating protein [Poseidonibacter ostreae]KAB7887125.1 anaerobic ribonucleoside-triphosphate reductase activating protein [Poseidonibacter ostreae]KAB7888631.1 anaerobic ribonucleoside-triphosphate reductase activating protein [Poseidonibacter ostreae]KAB7892322.1 anaerobic ribonucleoside-triphosphate reductase activating protein [Poseidonibacter ostreae]MAC82780.1 anaerobic ribonucleoside-triphosphate reductase activating protein [Arcobacter
MNQKIVYNLTKFTSTDYVGHLSCVVWFIKCNFRCLYCYNDDLVYSKEGNYSLNECLEFLKTRVGLLDSVVLSGGEATIHDLIPFCNEIKKLGFKIKLDTNATNQKQIKELIELNLIDYMAIDFKAPKDKFYEITKSKKYDEYIQTIKYLIDIDFDFEIRTTIHSKLLSSKDINSMIRTLEELEYKNTYYLQNYLQTSSNIGNINEQSIINKEDITSNNLNISWRN